jgi:dihydrolipoamide dehydrogenase
LARHGIVVGQLSIDLARMMTRKEQVVKALTTGVGSLFRKNKVEHIVGHGTITAPGTVQVDRKSYTAKRLLIATGSAPIELPGLKYDGKSILSSTEVLTLTEIPKKLIVVGAGYIGLEMASVWSRLGSDILVLEFLDRCLPPSDAEMASALQKLLEKQGLKFRFGTVAQSATVENGQVKVTWKSGDEMGLEQVDKVLVCVGRRPVTDNLGLDKIGVTINPKGFIVVDEKYQTNVPGIFAIGDVIGRIMLAHNAEEEGIAAVELMAGKAGHVNYHCCPSVVYTHPELAQVGFTEEQARQRGPVNIGKFPFIANGRARGMDETDGFVKVIADAKTDRVLGVHILAAHASDVIAEATVAMEFGASSEDIGRSFHAHPTLPEALKEAALAVEKRAIHI